MRNITTLLLLFLFSHARGQNIDINRSAQAIVAEGRVLYRSEMASWYGTDVFLAQYPDKSAIGGYLSYSKCDAHTCIFFSNAEPPRVIGTMTFDSTFNVGTVHTDLTERDFLPEEKDLFEMRRNALRLIVADSMFETYRNTNLNLIPVIYQGRKKVYVLTGPEQEGVVIFGNDYLIDFNERNEITDKKRLHRNIIPVSYGSKTEDGNEAVATLHNHSPETGELITPTDVCTLLLYGKYTSWKQHHVISKTYMSIWDCKRNDLTVVSMEALEKIDKDQEKRQKKADRKKRKDKDR